MNIILSVVFGIEGLFLIWQGVGFNGLISWCHRLVIPSLDSNIFLMTAGAVCTRFAILLGVLSVVFSVLMLKDKNAMTEGVKNRGSYFGFLSFMTLFTILSLV